MSDDPPPSRSMEHCLEEIEKVKGILQTHENRLTRIESSLDQVLKLAQGNQELLRYCMVGLLAIVGAVVGLKLLPT
mgnify:CR=1 FL=1